MGAAHFLLSVSGPLVDLGLGETLEDALLKLSAASPTATRADAAQVRQRIYVDMGSHCSQQALPHLEVIQEAIWQDRKLRLTCGRYSICYYDPGNILLDQRRVTAVLDFEFAGRDIRVLELCVALSWWPVHLLGTGTEWELIDTFGSAYTQQLALSEKELLALPAVFRLRDATSLVHRTGRYLAGMEDEVRMQRRVEHSLWREAWVSAHQNTLLDHALAWK